jgi:hypothetical protein
MWMPTFTLSSYNPIKTLNNLPGKLKILVCLDCELTKIENIPDNLEQIYLNWEFNNLNFISKLYPKLKINML